MCKACFLSTSCQLLHMQANLMQTAKLTYRYHQPSQCLLQSAVLRKQCIIALQCSILSQSVKPQMQQTLQLRVCQERPSITLQHNGRPHMEQCSHIQILIGQKVYQQIVQQL